MDTVVLHDAFVGQGRDPGRAPEPAVSVGAGAIWMQVYDAVTTRGGRYVQGGGCTTVGVAGLVQSGGFGSFSKRYGLAASGLLEAEIVTADGAVRTANARNEPELFWALKGGGGGVFGVVTRLTLRTRPLPAFFGGVFGTVRAASDAAFRSLIARLVAFYGERLFNAAWGETATLRPDNTLSIAMVFAGLDRQEAEGIWAPFLDWIAASPGDFAVAAPFQVIAAPARHLWDVAWLKRNVPGVLIADDRFGAPEGNAYWAGDAGQVGQFLHGYDWVWLPASLLGGEEEQRRLCDALFAGTRRWGIALHFNKGLAGAPAEAIAGARGTPIHPSAIDAFALAISAAHGPPAFPGLPGPGPDLTAARRRAAEVAAIAEMRKLAPGGGSYVAEGDYFNGDWQNAHWGPNYPRLLAVKEKYDPAGLFFVHHGVGSEGWSAGGFTKPT